MYNSYNNFRSGYLQEGDPVGMTAFDASLTADNQVIDVSNYTLVRITSDNTTATNRTFSITNGIVVGHQVLLTLVSAGATAADLQDTGNVNLSAAWQPTQDDTLSLVWQGSKWVEVGRSDN